MSDHSARRTSLTRRTLLTATAAAGLAAAAGLQPSHRIPAGSAAATLTPPPGFPTGIPLSQQAFRNWSLEIVVEDVWTAAARTPDDVVTLANWAHEQGYRLRARGKGHTWSPLVVPAGADTSRTLIVDTTSHLTAVSVRGGNPGSVTAQAGATLDTILTRLEESGLGLAATTAPGDLTIGGVLAIGGHGTGLPTAGEHPPAGSGFGTLSSLVTSLTAVVWNAAEGRYALRTFTRSDPDIRAFLVHLGRAFLTEVTMTAAANTRLRCRNWYDVNVATVFGPPGTGGRTISSYLEGTGRVEAIWFPFTDVPWLKVWSVAPAKPWLAKQLDAPYPYSFANRVTEDMSKLLGEIAAGGGDKTPDFTKLAMSIVGSGLIVTGTWDVWGWSKNSLLYVEPTTLRIVEAGWAVLTSRANVQRVVSDFYGHYKSVLAAHQSRGSYPVNGPIELRITGTDPHDGPLLSPALARPDHPEWDTVVWLDFATYPGTPGAAPFFREMEQRIWQTYTGSYATVRPEWSKGWAYTDSGPWTDPATLGNTVPAAFHDWRTAQATLNSYDPARVFSNAFLDTLLP
ncbi:cholesterol oxidase substrate-binding domain-containing protein [Streptomyces sp. NRRL S-1448]|uniref:cholesterol oxidase substrate-binding domain-containing protein n=1 Tax=Streptomyces sp. NRRL S-1448 TaxID=1463883 RepID=UPI0004C02AEE|nr:cholesterol oxidase substrate-binding domain-containing protein [Streptomyces sp. NRRL S-1448]